MEYNFIILSLLLILVEKTQESYTVCATTREIHISGYLRVLRETLDQFSDLRSSIISMHPGPIPRTESEIYFSVNSKSSSPYYVIMITYKDTFIICVKITDIKHFRIFFL